MSRRPLFLLVLFVGAGGAGNAIAEEARPLVGQHRLGADLGVASAMGIAGIDYQFAPYPWLRLEAAAGWGPTGAQFSMMPKIALGRGTCAFTIGFGPSLAVAGQQAAAGHGPNPGAIPWLNLDLPGLECHSPAGVSVQATLGVTMPLADFHWDVADVGNTIHAGALLPQGRVGVGWWF